MKVLDILKKRQEYNEGLIKELSKLEREQYRKIGTIKEKLRLFQQKKNETNKEIKELDEVIKKMEEEADEL